MELAKVFKILKITRDENHLKPMKTNELPENKCYRRAQNGEGRSKTW